jgi:DNA-binding MarR family transcriptional regulator
MTEPPPSAGDYDDVPLSALLRAARNTYSRAVEVAHSKSGCDDLPANGAYLISAMHWSGASLESVIRWMGVTKQAVGQTVDTLVLRGYLERSQEPLDRRRVNLTLTERGREAGRVARSAIEQVDRKLRDRVGARKVADARATLTALIELDLNVRGPKDRPSARRPSAPPPGPIAH